jgi:hypothetical protein
VEYARTIAFQGDPGKAMDAAAAMLTPLGFVITQKRLTSLELAGPGLRSTRQAPILGATTIVLKGDHGRMTLEAELGGVAAMRRFLYLFPTGLGAAFVLVFGVGMGFLFGRQFGVGFGVPWAPGREWLYFAVPLSLLPLSPWLVLSPLMARRTRRRTIAALDVFLTSLQPRAVESVAR